jgi:hypothetical protein
MLPRMQRSVIGVGVIALIGALAWVLIPLNEPNRWRTAIAESPAGADRYSWTDWAAMRDQLGHPKAGALETAAFNADLLETTALRSRSGDLTQMGLSENDLDSELLVQSKDGDAEILRLTKSVDPATWKGWSKHDGYWTAPPTMLTEVLAYVAVADGGHTLVGSNNAPYLKQALAALHQSNPIPPTVVSQDDAVPVSAFTYSGNYACSHLAMGLASSEDQASGQDLVARAGSVNPLTGYTLARFSATSVSASLGFENADQARRNADSRSALAAGPAPGMGGAFTDRFTLGEVSATGNVVTMRLTPVEHEPLMSELSGGPVLFATC